MTYFVSDTLSPLWGFGVIGGGTGAGGVSPFGG